MGTEMYVPDSTSFLFYDYYSCQSINTLTNSKMLFDTALEIFFLKLCNRWGRSLNPGNTIYIDNCGDKQVKHLPLFAICYINIIK